MAVRFFMLQAHYRSTLDFSNEALDAAEKGYKRLMNSLTLLPHLKASEEGNSHRIGDLKAKCLDAMNDDFNSPVLIAELFEAARLINSVYDEKTFLTKEQIQELTALMEQFVFEVLGLKDDTEEDFDALMAMVIDLRNEAKTKKDYVSSDKIRDGLQKIGVQLKDNKHTTLWVKN